MSQCPNFNHPNTSQDFAAALQNDNDRDTHSLPAAVDNGILPPASLQCWECFRRKSSCDGEIPLCGNCGAAGLVCPGYDNRRHLTWTEEGNSIIDRSNDMVNFTPGYESVSSCSRMSNSHIQNQATKKSAEAIDEDIWYASANDELHLKYRGAFAGPDATQTDDFMNDGQFHSPRTRGAMIRNHVQDDKVSQPRRLFNSRISPRRELEYHYDAFIEHTQSDSSFGPSFTTDTSLGQPTEIFEPVFDMTSSQPNVFEPENTDYLQSFGLSKIKINENKIAHSDNPRSSKTKIETYVAVFSQELLEHLAPKKLESHSMQRITAVLPWLLKALALKLDYGATSQVQHKIMFFVYEHRYDIIKSFQEKYIQSINQRLGPMLDETYRGKSTEKHDNWFEATDGVDTRPEVSQHDSDSRFSTSSHTLDEELDDEMEDISTEEFEECKTLLFNDLAFEWLLGRLNRELLLSRSQQDIMENLRKDILGDLPSSLCRKKKAQRAKAVYYMDWNPSAFFDEQGYDDLYSSVIPDVITLTGSCIDAQALSCREYIEQTWPQTGTATLRLIQKLLSTDNTNKVTRNVLDGLTLWASMIDSKVVIEALGVPGFVAEIGEQIAWLGAALQPSTFPNEVAYCTPFIDKKVPHAIFYGDEIVLGLHCYIKFNFEKCEPAYSDTNGQCWHNMFKGPVIVRGFPIPKRSENNTGLEMPLNMMAALVRTRYVNTFNSMIYIKGFSSMLVPTKRLDGLTVWHYLYNRHPDDHISYMDCSVDHADVELSELESTRHVIGWCSEAVATAGTLAATYCVKKSGLPFSRCDVSLDKFEITAGKVVSGTAKFTLGGRQSPVHISNSGYLTKMKWISSKYFILWDEGDKRGWLVDGTRALLHLLRASLEQNKRIFNSDFLLDPIDLADCYDQSPNGSAMSVLMDQRNRNLKLYVDKTEVFDEEIEDGQETRTISIKKKRYYRLEDEIEHIYNTVEKLIAREIDEERKKGIQIKSRPRRNLEGWDFNDLISGNDPVFRRVCTIPTIGKGWVDFTRGIHAFTLFGRGFGDLIYPKTANCPRWSCLPKEKYYLATLVVDLERIMEDYGESTSNPRKLCDNVLWHMRQGSFQACPCVKERKAKHHDPVQALFPFKFKSNLKKKPLEYLEADGAVIFGHNINLHWHWKDNGDPVEGDPPQDVEDSTDSLEDSSIGSSTLRLLTNVDGIESSSTESPPSSSGTTSTTAESAQTDNSTDINHRGSKRHLQDVFSWKRKKTKF